MSNTLRSRVSRETRQLLVAALVALLALWVLARIRFPGQPPTPNPIPSLLSQLSVSPRFTNLAGEVAELQGRLANSWLAIPVSGTDDSLDNGRRHLAAMRLSNDAALTLLGRGDRLANDENLVATDRATGLTVVRTEGSLARSEVPPWSPPVLDSPRYLMETVGTATGVSLRPVLVGALHETTSPAWTGPIWSVPEGTDLAVSAFVFTTSGEIAGLVVREPSGLVIVPWTTLVAEAARIRDQARPSAADLRVEVQPLTSVLGRATGSSRGVVVTWVDPKGPLARRIAVGDVIESLNAQPISTLREWEVVSSRLPRSDDATIGVRRRGKSMNVDVALPAGDTPTPTTSLGLGLKDVPGVGATVLRIDPRSAAHAARLQEGDIITLAGETTAPTAARISEAFRSAQPGEVIMLAITRGSTHLVVGLVK